MKRNIRAGLALLLVCAALLTACGGKTSQQVNGLVTELQTGDDGQLTAFVVQTDDGSEVGILLADETLAYPPGDGSWTREELRAAFQAALRLDTAVSADCARGRKTLLTNSGTQITAYEAEHIHIIGGLNREAVTLRDGTRVDVAEGGVLFGRTYRLADGTELLRVNAPHGPAGSYVGGVGSFDDLSGTAQGQVLAFYEDWGLLYDEEAELEKAYALWQEKGMDFRCGLVEQSVSPTAFSGRVMYFLTTVILPADGQQSGTAYEIRLGDAFDRETGAHIDTWALFTASKEEVIQAILDESGITDQPLRAELEAAVWDGRVTVFPGSVSAAFEPDTLPSQEYSYILDAPCGPGTAVGGLMQDWAVPAGRK